MTDQDLKVHHASLIAAALLGQASKEDVDEVAELLAEFSASLLSRAIQEGHVVVPKEPTIEMIAALGFGGDVTMAIGYAAISEEIADSYRAALAAAPANKEGE